MDNINNSIKCDVESCKHNCKNYCDLNQIKVSCNCDTKLADKSETICDSFNKKD